MLIVLVRVLQEEHYWCPVALIDSFLILNHKKNTQEHKQWLVRVKPNVFPVSWPRLSNSYTTLTDVKDIMIVRSDPGVSFHQWTISKYKDWKDIYLIAKIHTPTCLHTPTHIQGAGGQEYVLLLITAHWAVYEELIKNNKGFSLFKISISFSVTSNLTVIMWKHFFYVFKNACYHLQIICFILLFTKKK